MKPLTLALLVAVLAVLGGCTRSPNVEPKPDDAPPKAEQSATTPDPTTPESADTNAAIAQPPAALDTTPGPSPNTAPSEPPPAGELDAVPAEPPLALTEDPLLKECKELKARFLARLGAATYACSTDADCSNRPGGIEGGGCGSVVDKTSAEELFVIYSEIRERCALDLHCAPRVSIPVCREGHCVRQQEHDPPVIIEGEQRKEDLLLKPEHGNYTLEVFLNYDGLDDDEKAKAQAQLLPQLGTVLACFEAQPEVDKVCVSLESKGKKKLERSLYCIPMRKDKPVYPEFSDCVERAAAEWELDGLSKRDAANISFTSRRRMGARRLVETRRRQYLVYSGQEQRALRRPSARALRLSLEYAESVEGAH
ncbi:MAG: hypothetical protein RBU37_27885, partial [Myxococcota bacterium]|nr:hypothetical protein [Myxococcota bacterium]